MENQTCQVQEKSIQDEIIAKEHGQIKKRNFDDTQRMQ